MELLRNTTNKALPYLSSIQVEQNGPKQFSVQKDMASTDQLKVQDIFSVKDYICLVRTLSEPAFRCTCIRTMHSSGFIKQDLLHLHCFGPDP